MPYIRVANADTGKFDYASTIMLDSLIESNKITHFFRPSENRWVNVKWGGIRGQGGEYHGPERRRNAEGRNWVDNMCGDIEKFW